MRQSELLLNAVILSFLCLAARADKGYDMEETPAGAYSPYCVPLKYNFEVGICQGLTSSVNVCAVTAESPNKDSAFQWLQTEVMPANAPIMDKSIVPGDGAYNKLVLYLHEWMCKQAGAPRMTGLSDAQQQQAVCSFVWRRDQEIQKMGAPTPGAPWGTFTYQASTSNPIVRSFIFKGAPLNQCKHDYDCSRTSIADLNNALSNPGAFNNPGQVYVCCDYCEQYFASYCDMTPAQITKFCMEKVQCVCNSVTKPCASKYIVWGAPCSTAAAGPAVWLQTALAAAVLTFAATHAAAR